MDQEDVLLAAFRRMPMPVRNHFANMASYIADSFPALESVDDPRLKLVFIAPSIKTRAVDEDR